MKRLAEWQYGKPHEKKLLERCRDIVVGIVPCAEVILYGFRGGGETDGQET